MCRSAFMRALSTSTPPAASTFEAAASKLNAQAISVPNPASAASVAAAWRAVCPTVPNSGPTNTPAVASSPSSSPFGCQRASAHT